MRIISPFKDYYDTAQEHVRDDLPRYIRVTKSYPLNCSAQARTPEHANIIAPGERLLALYLAMPRCLGMSSGLIAFCGKLYPFYVSAYYDDGRYHREVLHTPDKYIAHILKMKELGDLHGGIGKDEARKLISAFEAKPRSEWDRDLSRFNWETYSKKYPTLGDNIFRAFDAPVLLVLQEAFQVNPCLRPFNLAARVPPYEAYQEIDMFLGNNLAKQEDPSSSMTDALKIHAHGFDKWSFRKPPSEKKK